MKSSHKKWHEDAKKKGAVSKPDPVQSTVDRVEIESSEDVLDLIEPGETMGSVRDQRKAAALAVSLQELRDHMKKVRDEEE